MFRPHYEAQDGRPEEKRTSSKTKGDGDNDGPKFTEFTNEAKDLILQLLDIDQDKRLGARDMPGIKGLYEHPYFKVRLDSFARSSRARCRTAPGGRLFRSGWKRELSRHPLTFDNECYMVPAAHLVHLVPATRLPIGY